LNAKTYDQFVCKEDFPAPPVPVIPMMGILKFLDFSFKAETNSGFSSEKFSTAEIT
jgi:hypothetical protein